MGGRKERADGWAEGEGKGGCGFTSLIIGSKK
jgi:hypothetical protein